MEGMEDCSESRTMNNPALLQLARVGMNQTGQMCDDRFEATKNTRFMSQIN